MAESTELSKRLLRCTLLLPESVAYWEHVDPRADAAARLREASRDRWFGAPKHPSRIANLLGELAARFDAFPHALRMLQWVTLPVALRPLVCHVHFALTDARYRRFTGELLADRRERGLGSVGVEHVADWLAANERSLSERSSGLGLARRLLAAARDAGLVDEAGELRPLGPAEVPPTTLAYVLYLLRDLRFAGALLDNAYLRSLGLAGPRLAEALASAPGVTPSTRGRDGVELLEVGMLEWGERHLATP